MKDYYFQGWSCDLEMFCHIFELVIPVKKQKQKKSPCFERTKTSICILNIFQKPIYSKTNSLILLFNILKMVIKTI